MRVDLHSHTMWSGDATTTPDELEAAVADSGVDVLCITDHNTINGALALRDALPCRVVVASPDHMVWLWRSTRTQPSGGGSARCGWRSAAITGAGYRRRVAALAGG